MSNEKENLEAKQNCIFCKILSGEFECSEIYRDNDIVAFLDVQPINKGHALVIPIKHSTYLEDLNPDVGAKMFKLGLKISRAIRNSKISADGINFHLSDGEAAGQMVWHTHLHVYPRIKEDGFGLKHSSIQPPRSDLDQVAELIREKLNE